MLKLAEEQAVMAEVAGATSSLLDSGVVKLASDEDVDLLIKVATEISLSEGYSTPYELVENILTADAYLSKNASEMEFEDLDEDVEDYDEDEEDAEEDAIQEVLKEASDEDEAMEMFDHYYNAGIIGEDTMDKIASAYEEGEFEKVALFGKKSLKKRIGKSIAKNKKALGKKWGKLKPFTRTAIKGSGALAALGAAGAGGYYAAGRK